MTNDDRPLFILGRNGTYGNRGCEAIVRGSVKILRKYFERPLFICGTNYTTYYDYEFYKSSECDPDIILKPMNIYEKSDIRYYMRYISSRFSSKSNLSQKIYGHLLYGDLIPDLKKPTAVLSVGGDGYSLDYGLKGLKSAIEFDNIVMANNSPIFLWGMSVGPFTSLPKCEKEMISHLNKINGIFAREQSSVKYLKKINVVDNVYSVCDPAFVMDPKKPTRDKFFSIFDNSIGLNFSPLMANYVSGGNLDSWKNMVSKIMDGILLRSDCHLYLIPHVTERGFYDDYSFMKDIINLRDKNERISLIPPIYNAEETKWIISQMKVFAGSRTHSTIASLSSCIPTLSLAYSLKAEGINLDVYGNLDYCIKPNISNINEIVDKIIYLYNSSYERTKELVKIIPDIQRRSYCAGEYLKNILCDNNL